MATEQSVLRLSIIITILIAAIGLGVGLFSGSAAIIFDGIYSLTDASMTMLALLVARLITSAGERRTSRWLHDRFSVGFWHLEPMVLGLNGMMLFSAATYALVNAVDSLMKGGRDLAFGPALIYAVLVVAITSAMAIYGHRANRHIGSSFLALDVKAWVISSALTGALLVAFAFGWAIQGTGLAWLSPYIDPTALAIICLVVLPMPIPTIRQALSDILLVTPSHMKREIDQIAQDAVREYGFLAHRAYVARVGRGRQIELHFIVPAGWPAKRLEDWDAIRNTISDRIGGEGPNRWLTIAFTTDPEWAE